VKILAALLIFALWISFGGACVSRQPPRASADSSGRAAAQPTVPQPQERNWGPLVSGLRLSIAIDPAVADQTTSRLLALIIQNSSEAAIRFKPFISLHLSGGSEDNTFWAPADLTMSKSDFPKRGFPRPPVGQPILSLARGESRTFNFHLEELGWDTSKSSYYRGESFYTIVPAGRYDLVASIELWEGQIETRGQMVKIPKGCNVQSGKIKLRVSLQDSRKVVATEN
jgi:hypothetical protein